MLGSDVGRDFWDRKLERVMDAAHLLGGEGSFEVRRMLGIHLLPSA